MKNVVGGIAAGALTLCALAAQAQVPVYGTSVNLEQARKIVAVAQIEAKKNSWPVAIAVVDNAGMLVAYERMDNTQTASVQVAIDKAVTAAVWRRSTKVYQDAVAGGGVGLRVLSLRDVVAAEGGLPLVVDGKIVGAVGVSGVNADQDGMVAAAGAAALK